jgi:hypothetical protein
LLWLSVKELFGIVAYAHAGAELRAIVFDHFSELITNSCLVVTGVSFAYESEKILICKVLNFVSMLSV